MKKYSLSVFCDRSTTVLSLTSSKKKFFVYDFFFFLLIIFFVSADHGDALWPIVYDCDRIVYFFLDHNAKNPGYCLPCDVYYFANVPGDGFFMFLECVAASSL